jgi:hypothetical protein
MWLEQVLRSLIAPAVGGSLVALVQEFVVLKFIFHVADSVSRSLAACASESTKAVEEEANLRVSAAAKEAADRSREHSEKLLQQERAAMDSHFKSALRDMAHANQRDQESKARVSQLEAMMRKTLEHLTKVQRELEDERSSFRSESTSDDLGEENRSPSRFEKMPVRSALRPPTRPPRPPRAPAAQRRTITPQDDASLTRWFQDA